MRVTKFGQPGMITAVDMNPTAQYARVTRMKKPFSYIVPTSSFGAIEEVWDRSGKALAKITERELNLGVQDDTPDPVPDPTQPATQPAAQGGGGGRGGAQNDNGKRELTWRPDGQGFTYLQLEPLPTPAPGGGRANAAGGDNAAPTGGRGAGAGGRQGGQAAPRKDRLMHWAPPFGDADAKLIYENPTRMTGVRFSPDGQIFFFTENNATVAIYTSDTTQKYTIARAAGGGRGADANAAGGAAPGGGAGAGGQGAGRGDGPGTLVGVAGTGGGGGGGRGGGGRGGGGGGGGGPVLLSADGTSVFLQGTISGGRGTNAPPAKAFIDKVNIKTGEKTRVFEGENTTLQETISAILDADAKRLVLTRQNATTPPQQFLFDGTARKQLTNNEDLFPDLTRMIIQRFTVTRPDGFTFRTTAYLPANYQPNTRLPGFFWFYPAEFTSQEQYDNGRGGGAAAGAQYNFPNFGTLSKQFLVRLGYAVIENDSPIVGPDGSDEQQLRQRPAEQPGRHHRRARQAATDRPHAPGDRRPQLRRVLDRQRDGQHAVLQGRNRRRRRLQPHAHAARLPDRAPGSVDGAERVPRHVAVPQGEQPDRRAADVSRHARSERRHGPDQFDPAVPRVERLGKTVALYRYPFEDHGPAGRETLLDLWSRWAAWLDKYVKNPQPITKPAPAPAAGTGTGRGGQ